MANGPWAPQSPDLSGYAPQSPDLSAFKPPTSDFQTSWTPQSPDISGLSNYPPPQQRQQPLHPDPFDLYTPWNPQLHPSYNEPQPFHQQPQYGFNPSQSLYPPQDPMPQTRAQRVVKPETEDAEWNTQTTPAKPARGKKKSEAQAVSLKKMDTGGVEVKTTFPVARIKRIMQADEDVGKVAQVTPHVVAKALELFMIRLITASAAVAKSRNSKRVLTTHMKNAVMQDEQFDNLRPIVEKIPDAPVKGGGGGGGGGGKDDDDDDTGDAAPKKRKKSAAGGAKGKKRRNSDDDQ